MKGRTGVIVGRIFFFASVLVLAEFIARLMNSFGLPSWLELSFLLIGTKIVVDIVSAIVKADKRFLYFEDYLRETLVYVVVAAIGVAGVVAVEYYFGGAVWEPLLAAGLVYVWQV